MVGNTVQYVLIDAFTDSPFKGNPAAVCLLEEEKSDEWMRSVAVEFNIANTSFLTPLLPSVDAEDCGGNPRYGLRWFTLGTEVKICGHGTLAAAHFLFTSCLATTDAIEFLTKSGLLIAKRVNKSKQPGILALPNDDAEGHFWIELDFPTISLIDCDPAEVPSIPRTLNGATVENIKKAEILNDLVLHRGTNANSKHAFPRETFLPFGAFWRAPICGCPDLETQVELSSGKAVADLQPQFDELRKCAGRGVIVTGLAPTESGFDFFTRFFCPKLGINEDPVCGSAHCAMAPYWSKKLKKNDLSAYMASPRGGRLDLHLEEANQRVFIQGQAVTIMAGSILV